MSHSFSFLVSRNTQLNKAAIWLSFSFIINTMVVLFVDFYRRLASLNDVLWRHLTASNTQFIIMAWRLWRSSVTHSFYFYIFTASAVRFGWSSCCDASVDFTHLQHTINNNLEAVRRDHLSSMTF